MVCSSQNMNTQIDTISGNYYLLELSCIVPDISVRRNMELGMTEKRLKPCNVREPTLR